MFHNLAATSVENSFFSNNANTILAACVLVLAGVVVYVFHLYLKSQQDKEDIQRQRLEEAKETRDKLVDQSAKQTELSTKIYELLLSGKREN